LSVTVSNPLLTVRFKTQRGIKSRVDSHSKVVGERFNYFVFNGEDGPQFRSSGCFGAASLYPMPRAAAVFNIKAGERVIFQRQ